MCRLIPRNVDNRASVSVVGVDAIRKRNSKRETMSKRLLLRLHILANLVLSGAVRKRNEKHHTIAEWLSMQFHACAYPAEYRL